MEYNADWHAKRNGFESESERWRLSNEIDNSIAENIKEYQNWHFGDGAKEGLLKLIKELKKKNENSYYHTTLSRIFKVC